MARPSEPERKPEWKHVAAGAFFLVAATAFLYAPVHGHDFVTYDDPMYVTDNVEVQKGLTVEGLRWAATTTTTGNWHPITWMAHMIDVTLWGDRPGPHHLTSAAIHVLNALLVYLLLVAMTGAIVPSLFVAAAFALHPLHVESVAWVAERKDLLCAFFGLLALGAWVAWTRGRGAILYALSLLAYALSLAAKPMLVTLPILLLRLDVWPLGRVDASGGHAGEIHAPGAAGAWSRLRDAARSLERRWARRLVEKAPFAVLAAVFSLVALAAQTRVGAAATLDAVGLGSRIQNAIVACASYIVSTVYPVDLGVLYPLRESMPVWMLEGAAFLLVVATLLCLSGARRRPWLAVGWLWYLVSLLPVLGLVQIGVQSRADRYTYLLQPCTEGGQSQSGHSLQSRRRARAIRRAGRGGGALPRGAGLRARLHRGAQQPRKRAPPDGPARGSDHRVQRRDPL